MVYIIHSEPSGFAAFILTSAILFMIIRGIIRTIIKIIKYFISMPKKKRRAEEWRQMKEKWRLQDEAWRIKEEKWACYDKHVAELEKAIENASSYEEKKALNKQLIAFMKENLK